MIGILAAVAMLVPNADVVFASTYSASSLEECPYVDGAQFYLNKDGECMNLKECIDINSIITEECQPKYREDWPDPECPYGLILGGNDDCYHIEGYPIDEDH